MERLTYYTYVFYCYLPKGAWEEIRFSKTAEHVFVMNYGISGSHVCQGLLHGGAFCQTLFRGLCKSEGHI